MTAGHCKLSQTAADYRVISGSTDTTKGKISHVKQLHRHPKYRVTFSQSTGPFSDLWDYMILELKKPIDLGEGSMARAVCLPKKDDMAKFKQGETILVTSGWGEGTEPENELRHIEVPWVTHSYCKKALLRRLKEWDYKNDKLTKKAIKDSGGNEKFADGIIHETVTCAGNSTDSNVRWNNPRTGGGDSGGMF